MKYLWMGNSVLISELEAVTGVELIRMQKFMGYLKILFYIA